MDLGFSGKAFGNLVILMVLLALVAIALITTVAKKRGIDISSNRFQLKLGISCLIICLVPFLFTDRPFLVKIIILLIGLAGGIANFFVIDRMQKFLKDKFIDKKK
jgi:hypothetical protein